MCQVEQGEAMTKEQLFDINNELLCELHQECTVPELYWISETLLNIKRRVADRQKLEYNYANRAQNAMNMFVSSRAK